MSLQFHRSSLLISSVCSKRLREAHPLLQVKAASALGRDLNRNWIFLQVAFVYIGSRERLIGFGAMLPLSAWLNSVPKTIILDLC